MHSSSIQGTQPLPFLSFFVIPLLVHLSNGFVLDFKSYLIQDDKTPWEMNEGREYKLAKGGCSNHQTTTFLWCPVPKAVYLWQSIYSEFKAEQCLGQPSWSIDGIRSNPTIRNERQYQI